MGGRCLASPLAVAAGASCVGGCDRKGGGDQGGASRLGEGLYEHLSLGTDREKAGEHLLLYGSLLRRLWNRLYHGVAWHPGAWRSVSNWPRHAVLPANGPLLLRRTLRAWSWHLGKERDWSDPGQQGQNCAYESKMPANGEVADRFFVGVGGGWAASVGLPTQEGMVGSEPPERGVSRNEPGKGGKKHGRTSGAFLPTPETIAE